MARRCPRCKNKAVRLDRSLSGRAICAGCGMVRPATDSKATNIFHSFGNTKGSFRPNTKTIIALVFSTCLLGSYAYLWSNPRLAARLLAPYTEAGRKSWHIKTSADIELLIGKSQQAVAPSGLPSFLVNVGAPASGYLSLTAAPHECANTIAQPDPR